MSGALKPVGAAVNKMVAKNIFAGTAQKIGAALDKVPSPRYKGVSVFTQGVVGPSEQGRFADAVGRNMSDSEMVRDNPTTPFSKNDAATSINDPLNLTGEPGRDAERKAQEEAARIIAAMPGPKPLPDEDAMRRARRREEARRRSQGRASTVFATEDTANDVLGG